MYKNKEAFTLAEILIAMLVLGVLIALIMPQFTHLVTEKRRQVTANSYMKVYTDIENAIEEYSLINYSSPAMFYNLSTANIINALKPYLRIIEVSGSDQFTLYDGTTVKVGKRANVGGFDDTRINPTSGAVETVNRNINMVVFAYQRPNTFVAQVIYTNNGNTYFACKANCGNDEVFKLMSSTHNNAVDKDGNSLKTSNNNIDVRIYNGGVTPPVSKYENDEGST